MSVKKYPPLPGRRLKKYANGIWDEAKGVFYPFQSKYIGLTSSTAVLAKKKSVAYYIESCSIAGKTDNDDATVNVSFTGYQNNVQIYWCALVTGVSQYFTKERTDLGILLDVNNDISSYINAAPTTAIVFEVIYAEIPADAGEVVVVE